jgi:hypothetical protein
MPRSRPVMPVGGFDPTLARVPIKWTEPPAHPARPPTSTMPWVAGRGVRVGSTRWDALYSAEPPPTATAPMPLTVVVAGGSTSSVR